MSQKSNVQISGVQYSDGYCVLKLDNFLNLLFLPIFQVEI